MSQSYVRMTREERFNTRSASGRYDDIDRSDDRRRDSRDGRDDRYRSERRSPPRRFDDRQRNDDYRFGDRDRNFNRRNSGGGGFEQRGNSSGWRDLDRAGSVPQPMAPPLPPQQTQEEKLFSLLLMLGDKATSTAGLEKNIAGLAAVINKDLNRWGPFTINTAFQCALALPVKTSLYATLLGLLNAGSPQFGEEVVGRLHNELSQAFEKNKFMSAKYLVRFAAELANAKVISASDILALYEALLGPDSASSQGLSEYVCSLVIDSLPFVGKLLSFSSKANDDRLYKILDTIHDRTSAFNKEVYRAVEIVSEKTPLPYVRWAFNAIESQGEADWPELSAVLNPAEYLTSQLESATFHDLKVSQLKLPSAKTDNEIVSFPPPRNVFQLFKNVKHPLWNDRVLSNCNRFVIEEYIRDILYFFNGNPEKAAELIRQIPNPKGTNELFDVILETILGELLLLPRAPFKRVFYGLVVVELCKASPDNFVVVLAKGILILYDRLSDLDKESYMTFTEWFAHYLSNFDYKFFWNQWVGTNDPLKKQFIGEVIFRCIRFAHHERLEKIIPQELLPFFPPKPKSFFKYLIQDDLPGVDAARRIYNIMKTGAPLDALRNYVSTLSDLPRTVIVDALCSCLLQVGEKSFSSLQTNLINYLPLFKEYVSAAETSHQLMAAVFDYWKLSPQRILMVADQFIAQGLLAPQVVVDFIFSKEAAPMLTRQWLWELLILALDKSSSQFERLRAHFNSLPNPNNIQGAVVNIAAIEAYSKMEDELDQMFKDRKELYRSLFLHFKQKLVELKGDSSEDGVLRSKFVLGMLKAIGRKYFELVRTMVDFLDTLFEAGEDGAKVASEIKALASNY